jgi:hypothetical protein
VQISSDRARVVSDVCILEVWCLVAVRGAWGVPARAVGISRGGIGSSFFADLDELLGILVLQSCVVLGFYLCFLLLVCLLGLLENVDEMFTLRTLVEFEIPVWGSRYTDLTCDSSGTIVKIISYKNIVSQIWFIIQCQDPYAFLCNFLSVRTFDNPIRKLRT